MLTPVSFKKGRAAAPRLTALYVPGRHSDRFWREHELKLIRQNYEAKGAAFCAVALPGRTMCGVYAQAGKLGLSAPKQRAARVLVGTSLDEKIRERWPFLKGRGAVAALAEELGVRRHVVSRRASCLGLALPHKKEPRWTKEEDALLRMAPATDTKVASKFFAAHGFKRSPASIGVRCQRLGVSRRRVDVFSAGAAARILGIDSKTMACWCAEGVVRATRRGTQRLPQQGGDTWTIQPADLRQFVVDQLDRIDIRKVDKHAFVELLIAPAAAEVLMVREQA